MEKYAWRATVNEGCLDEYIKRHDEIWEEMKAVLKEAGIANYTIWTDGKNLFGYYECEKGVEYAKRVQNESPVVAKWNVYMKDVMTMKTAEGESQPTLKCVFNLD